MLSLVEHKEKLLKYECKNSDNSYRSTSQAHGWPVRGNPLGKKRMEWHSLDPKREKKCQPQIIYATQLSVVLENEIKILGKQRKIEQLHLY